MTRKAIAAIAAATLTIAAAGMSVWVLWPFGMPHADPDTIERGARIYSESCASCHGARLEGQPAWQTRNSSGRLPAPPHDASGHTWHHSTKILFEITKYGVTRFAGENYQSDMPAFEGRLSDDEICAAIVYIKSWWPPEIRRIHSEIDRKSRS